MWCNNWNWRGCIISNWIVLFQITIYILWRPSASYLLFKIITLQVGRRPHLSKVVQAGAKADPNNANNNNTIQHQTFASAAAMTVEYASDKDNNCFFKQPDRLVIALPRQINLGFNCALKEKFGNCLDSLASNSNGGAHQKDQV